MTTRYAYVPAKRSDVGNSLSALFASLESGDATYSRAANFNVIVPLSSRNLLGTIEADIDALSLCHPSRFFVVYLDDGLSDLCAEVSARCQALSKSEHVCSEIVRIGCPRSKIGGLPSLIRANMLTGNPSEFYLYDSQFPMDDLRSLSSLSDTVMLDSADFEGRESELAAVTSFAKSVLDLQWVALGIWRDEIKDLFGRSIIREYAHLVDSVSITSESPQARPGSAPGVLLGAWIASRLGYNGPISRAGQGFRCAGPGGKRLRIDLDAVAGQGASNIREVVFRFEALRIGPTPQEQYIRLSRAESLSSTVELRASFRSSRPFDDESRKGRLLRFFLIGESMANYTAAARMAQEFYSLQK